MTSANLWLQQNMDYLSASLEWLRLLLEQRLGVAGQSEQSDRGRADAARSEFTAEMSPLQAAVLKRERIESSMQSPPALTLLCERLQLSRFEQDTLLLAAAAEFDPAMSALFAQAGDGCAGQATFALALSLFEEPAWNALSPQRPLRYWRLVEIHQPGAQTLISSALRADERIVNYIKGLNYLDDRLSPYVTPADVSGTDGALPHSQQAAVARIRSCWHQAQASTSIALIQLVGVDGASKQSVAAQAAAEIDHQLYRMPVDGLPQQAAELELLVSLWQRESALLPVALYFDAQEMEVASASASSTLVRKFLSRADGVFLLAVREVWPSAATQFLAVEVAKPTAEEQREQWTGILEDDEALPALLAGQFNLSFSEIQQIARNTAADGSSEEGSTADRVWDACCMRVRPSLDALAHRLELKAGWKDLVLPTQEMILVEQIAGQVKQRTRVYAEWGFALKMNRGLGITALFAGESGTGKTLAAEVLANELRLNLYRIDLSAIVSKYIGETEKNLRRLFDAAEEGGSILFFDEADALFGKRSEVKDSHDRYANIEVNYLLQRMEAYRGLAILATNLRSALDVAFTRRLRFIVTFPFPTVADRAQMWRRVFPQKTPVEDLDYSRLARVNLTGGSIHNVAINAAFLAAETGGPVNMGAVLTSIRNELIKMGRPINDADFRWHTPAEEVA